MKVIKNGVVNMQWNADHFLESRKSGFVAAINVYKNDSGASIPVIFQDQKIYILLDQDTMKPADVSDIIGVIKECFKEDLDIDVELEESYVELGVGSVDYEDVARMYGLSDSDIVDINNRCDDLAPYWEVTEIDMFDE